MLDKLSAALNSLNQKTDKITPLNSKELYNLQNDAKLRYETRLAVKKSVYCKKDEETASLAKELYSKETSNAVKSLNSPNIHKYGNKIVIKES